MKMKQLVSTHFKRWGRHYSILGLLLVTLSGFQNCSDKVKFVSYSSQGGVTTKALGSVSINSGAQYTQSTIVNLSLDSKGANQMYVTNDSSCTSGGVWEPYATNKIWTLGQNNQSTAVYATFKADHLTPSECATATIVHDDVAPQVAVDTTVPAFYNVNSVNIKFHASDSGSGVAQLLCIQPGDVVMLPCTGTYTGTNLPDGIYDAQFLAIDLANNLSLPLSQAFGVDTTPPTVVINSAPTVLTSSTTAIFQFQGFDNLSGVSDYSCAIDSGAYAPCTSGVNYQTLSPGAHTFAVRATDNAQNISTPAKYNWTIDLTAPTIQFTQTPKPLSNSANATFGFIGVDNHGAPITIFQCSINGSKYVACNSPDLISGLSEGPNSFSVQGVNSLGVASAPLSYKWTIDLTAPVITITQTPKSLTNLDNATFIFTATDANGLGSVSCSIDLGAFQDCGTMTQTYLALAGDTQHEFQVQAYDLAGNFTVSDPYLWYIDKTAPDLKITAQPSPLSNQSSASFSFLATDAYGPITYQCKLDTSANFSPCTSPTVYNNLADGSHTFYVQAADAAGNLSTIQPYTWVIETAGPIITLTKVPTNIDLTTSQGVINYTVTDLVSKITGVVCTLDSVAIACSISAVGDGSVTLPLLTAGVHTFTITATNAANLTSSKNYVTTCTTSVATSNVLTKIIFVVDISGSNVGQGGSTATDVGTPTNGSYDRSTTMRYQSISTFFNDYKADSNFQWGFITFSSSASALINTGMVTTATFGDATAMSKALTGFLKQSDNGGTNYSAALAMASSLISKDPDLNSAKKPQYIMVFLSDGMPDNYSGNSTDYQKPVTDLINLASGRSTFSTVFYGGASASAANLLSDMALKFGNGNFLNTYTDPAGKDFKISNVIANPTNTCN